MLGPPNFCKSDFLDLFIVLFTFPVTMALGKRVTKPPVCLKYYFSVGSFCTLFLSITKYFQG